MEMYYMYSALLHKAHEWSQVGEVSPPVGLRLSACSIYETAERMSVKFGNLL